MKRFRLKNIIASILLVFSAVLFSLGCVFTQNQYTVKNSVTSVLSQDEPTDTSLYWTDESVIGEELLASGFTKGTGTAEDPYQISTAQELAYLSYMVYTGKGENTSSSYFYENKYFKQTADIDLSQYYWQPIGIRYKKDGTNTYKYFSGNYDGGNFIITGIFTKSGSSNAYSYQGLFGYIYAQNYNITIKNINVKDSNIQGYQYVGGIVGYGYKNSAEAITIENCSYSGNIYGTSSYVGGIVGNITSDDSSSMGNIKIANCYNKANIKGGNFTSGIVGYLSNCYSTSSTCKGSLVITNNYSTGVITGNLYTSGIISYANCGYLSIYNNFNNGEIIGTTHVGGILSSFTNNTRGYYYLSNNYNLNNIEGTSMVGAIIGCEKKGFDTFSSNYYGANCSSELGGAGASGSAVGEEVTGATYKDSLKIEDFKSKEFYLTYSNWNYSYPWDFYYLWGFKEGENDGFPVFVGKTVANYWIEDESRMEAFTGSGTEEDPYIIANAKNLVYLSYMVYSGEGEHTGNYYYENSYFKQTADIDLSGHLWQPIGIEYDRKGNKESRYFSGNYDGGNYTITGIETLANTTTPYSYQGLFGYIYAGNYDITIQNINVENSNVQGYQYVGGIVGYGNKSAAKVLKIDQCSYDGNIYATSNYVGGIAGYLQSGKSASAVSTYVSNCFNKATIKGVNFVGGIVGYAENFYSSNSYKGGKIYFYNCYNIGDITGNNYIAGIIGYAYTIYLYTYNNFNTAKVTGNSTLGGIIGLITGASSSNYYVYNNYNLNKISGTSSVGAIIGSINGTGFKNFGSNYYGAECDSLLGGVGVSGSITGEDKNGTGYKDSLKIEDFKSKEFYLTYSNWSYSYPWDFYYLWGFEEGENDGFPVFVGKTVANYWIEDESRMEAFTGSGTEEDPYIIANAKNLVYLSYMVYSGEGKSNGNYYYENTYFKQTADIDLSGYIWQPIGIEYDRSGAKVSHYFSGNYDGTNHIISGLETLANTITPYSYQGLFGYIYAQNYNITIKNINIKESNIQGYQYIGGIVGYGYKTTGRAIAIENCSYSGNVYGTSSYVGGIAASLTSSTGNSPKAITIKNCYNTANVKGSSAVGGIVGNMTNSYHNLYGASYSGACSILNCYNKGEVVSAGSAGGIIATMSSGYVYIYNNINMNKVTGGANVGGIIGNIYCYFSGTLGNNYNFGITKGSSFVGAIIGQNQKSPTISKNYYGAECDSLLGGVGVSGSITGEDKNGTNYKDSLKIEDLKSKKFYQTYSNWNFSYPWDFYYLWGFKEGENDGYPIFVGKSIQYWIDDASRMEAFTGSGTEEDPYLIANIKNLVYLSYMVYSGEGKSNGNYYYENTYFKQTADIDLSGYIWQPIGIEYDRSGNKVSRYFSGNYDGGNYTISGIETVASTVNAYSYQGLFGYIYAGNYDISIKNINIKDSNIQGYQYVGGIVGYGYKSAGNKITISYCNFSGEVVTVNGYAGGIAGYLNSKDSTSSKEINILHCNNLGLIQGQNSTGGIVGYLHNSDIPSPTNYRGTFYINYCYNYGIVEGTTNTGGIAGYALACYGYISFCGNYNQVTGTTNVGGIAGYFEGLSLTKCYNFANISGDGYVGGIVGKNSGTLSNCGVEGKIYSTDSTYCGTITGRGSVSNCYSIGESSAVKFAGGTSTSTNCVGVITVDGVENKVYKGSNFTGFVWINEDSSPVPKALVFMGSVTSNVTVALLQERGFVALS